MKTNDLIVAAAIVILAPIAVGAVIGVINAGIGVANMASKAIAKSKLKKLIKEGKIVEIDGQYFEVEISENEEE